MKTRTAVIGLAALAAVGVAAGIAYWVSSRQPREPFQASMERGEVLPVAEYRFSGPFTHANLTLYLVHGRETAPGGTYLTLQEALAQDKAVVHETGSVNELSIENLSDEEVFIQAGDVVKGGQQDRTIPYDFIAPARSGRLPLASFCVEQGRWAQRGDESKSKFSSAYFNLSGKSLKFASNAARDQGRVWEEVASMQRKIAVNLGKAEVETASRSSYQLLNEHADLQDAVAPYLAALEKAPADKTDVVGVAVVVNGKASSADVFGSARLFAKLWPKLLRGAAVEAFADLEKGKTFAAAPLDEVKRFLADAEAGGPADEAVTERVYVHARRTDRHMLFDTCDRGRDNIVIHRSFLAR